MTQRILVIEDDVAMCVALRDGFTYEGYEVEVAKDGVSGLQMASTAKWDLIVLDVMMPRLSGLDVCKKLRSDGNQTPIIMLTARGQEIDKVVGLRTGADDYVTKPFSFAEMTARVEAVLRRGSGRKSDPEVGKYQFGDIEIDFERYMATKADEPIELSAREFQLLYYFVRHRGEVVTREKMLDEIWSYNSPMTRTVDMHIAKLRQKIENDPESPSFIVTVHRAGYKFCG
jgi:two-component system alkaline phosphatase synthesis response regulator PhoP